MLSSTGRLPSVDTSSTTMSSNVGCCCGRTLSIARRRNRTPLYTGISTDTSGTADLGPDLAPVDLLIGDRESRGAHLGGERLARVLDDVRRVGEMEQPELLPKWHVPVAVDHRHAHQPSRRLRSTLHLAQKPAPVVDMLEHVRGDDGVEPLLRHVARRFTFDEG